MNRYQESEAQRRAIRERLKGASLFEHKTRGLLYSLTDGTYMSIEDYKKLRRQAGIWWIL